MFNHYFFGGEVRPSISWVLSKEVHVVDAEFCEKVMASLVENNYPEIKMVNSSGNQRATVPLQ